MTLPLDNLLRMPEQRAPIPPVAASLSCPCHKTDLGCPGALMVQFPSTMFEPSGALEYRIHRSQFLKQVSEMYDGFAEQARQALMARDPQTLRPPLEKLPLAVIEYGEIARAAVPWEHVADANEVDDAALD